MVLRKGLHRIPTPQKQVQWWYRTLLVLFNDLKGSAFCTLYQRERLRREGTSMR